MSVSSTPTIIVHAPDDLRRESTRRNRIEVAVVAGAKHLRDPYEGWIAADPFRGGVRLLITGAHGFQREVAFGMDEEPAVITQLVRATLDE